MKFTEKEFRIILRSLENKINELELQREQLETYHKYAIKQMKPEIMERIKQYEETEVDYQNLYSKVIDQYLKEKPPAGKEVKTVNYYLCQDCLYVIKSDKEEDWQKYHLEEEYCPKCEGQFCGCPGCQEEAKIQIKKGSL